MINYEELSLSIIILKSGVGLWEDMVIWNEDGFWEYPPDFTSKPYFNSLLRYIQKATTFGGQVKQINNIFTLKKGENISLPITKLLI